MSGCTWDQPQMQQGSSPQQCGSWNNFCKTQQNPGSQQCGTWNNFCGTQPVPGGGFGQQNGGFGQVSNRTWVQPPGVPQFGVTAWEPAQRFKCRLTQGSNTRIIFEGNCEFQKRVSSGSSIEDKLFSLADGRAIQFWGSGPNQMMAMYRSNPSTPDNFGNMQIFSATGVEGNDKVVRFDWGNSMQLKVTEIGSGSGSGSFLDKLIKALTE